MNEPDICGRCGLEHRNGCYCVENVTVAARLLGVIMGIAETECKLCSDLLFWGHPNEQEVIV